MSGMARPSLWNSPKEPTLGLKSAICLAKVVKEDEHRQTVDIAGDQGTSRSLLKCPANRVAGA